MTKEKPLTKNELLAYEVVHRMELKADGYHKNVYPYWCGWAIREAYLEGCNDQAAEIAKLRGLLERWQKFSNNLWISDFKEEADYFALDNDTSEALK